MAVTNATLKPSGYTGGDSTESYREWVYNSTADNLAAITAAGYFYDVTSKQVEISTVGGAGTFVKGEAVTAVGVAGTVLQVKSASIVVQLGVVTATLVGLVLTGGTSGATTAALTLALMTTVSNENELALNDVIRVVDSAGVVGLRRVSDHVFGSVAVLG